MGGYRLFNDVELSTGIIEFYCENEEKRRFVKQSLVRDLILLLRMV